MEKVLASCRLACILILAASVAQLLSPGPLYGTSCHLNPPKLLSHSLLLSRMRFSKNTNPIETHAASTTGQANICHVARNSHACLTWVLH